MATTTSKSKTVAKRADKSLAKGKSEIGDSSLGNAYGFVMGEYNPLLRGRSGYRIYDEMRMTDGTVAGLMKALTLPIRQANWFIENAGDTPEEIEQQEFVKENLFGLMSGTWDDFVRQALLNLVFGNSVFEKVFDIIDYYGEQRIILKKMAYRNSATIAKWEMENGDNGIQQQTAKGLVSIPIEKLVIFINDREGDSYTGMSVLRPAYKHWFIKNTFYKIDAIAFERQGLGIPYAKSTSESGWQNDDETNAKTILQNMYAQEQAYLLLNGTTEVGFVDMKAGSLRDPMPAINHHNREIMKSCLAQFLELGGQDASGGSFALSKDHSSFFLMSEEAVANNLRDAINKYVIPQLIDLNWDGVQKYPKLKYSGITIKDVKGIAETYGTLVEKGAVGMIEKDEQFFREHLGLPERTDEDKDIEIVRDVEEVTTK